MIVLCPALHVFVIHLVAGFPTVRLTVGNMIAMSDG